MGTRRAFQQQLKEMLTEETPVKEVSCMLPQRSVLAAPVCPWCPTFTLKQPANLSFFIEIIIIMLYTLDFTGSQHQAPFNFSWCTILILTLILLKKG